jgi:hypothetical protein
MLSLSLLARMEKSGASRSANWKAFQSAPALSTMMDLLKVNQLAHNLFYAAIGWSIECRVVVEVIH